MTDSTPADALDALVRTFDGAMAIVTTAVGPDRAGCLVGFHCQASIDPRRYAVWLSTANHTYRVSRRATHVAVHLVDRADGDLVELFGSETGDEVDKFARTPWDPGPGGVPLLRRCPARVVLRVLARLDAAGADHVCLMGEPVAGGGPGDGFDPLRLTDVLGLSPGHPA
ncbi:MAG TPA: flavin reductase family protein [Acidimicrobiales bacterium]